MAITLRIVLVENLRRLTEAIVRGRAARQDADALADDLLGIGDRPVATDAFLYTQFLFMEEAGGP